MSPNTPSVSKSFLEVILSNDVTGAVTWLGTILTIVGLASTFYQAREARRAARDAANGVTEAERMVRRIEHQSTLSDAAHISAQIEMIISLMRSQQYQTIQLLFGTIRRHITIMLVRLPPSAGQDEAIRKSVKAIQYQIINSINNPARFKSSMLEKALNALATTMAEWEQQLRAVRTPGES